MNEFYSISPERGKTKDSYQIENLGEQVVSMRTHYVQRDGQVGGDTVYHQTKSEDYDNKFAVILSITKPPYEIENILNYHFDFYTNDGGSTDKFIKHMQYVILPLLQRMKRMEVYVQILTNWINNKSMNNKDNQFGVPSITGNNNFINVAGGDIHQSGITINVTDNQYQELKELGVDEQHISELREIVSDNKQDKPTLKSKILKWLGAVTVAVASKGLIENLPKLQEFAHHLIP